MPCLPQNAMIELHYFPGNASLAPHLLLEELGIPYELKLVDRAHGAHKQADYLLLNPNGQIPVMVERRPPGHPGGDLILYEAAAICLHLVDTCPAAGLAPAMGSDERAHFYKWLVWLTNTLQAMLMHYFYPDRLVDDGDAHAAGQVKARAEARVGALLDLLDRQLASHGGHWLLGERFCAADLYALMLCRWTRGFTRPARDLPQVGPYLQRMLARPAVQRVFAQEGIAEPLV